MALDALAQLTMHYELHLVVSQLHVNAREMCLLGTFQNPSVLCCKVSTKVTLHISYTQWQLQLTCTCTLGFQLVLPTYLRKYNSKDSSVGHLESLRSSLVPTKSLKHHRKPINNCFLHVQFTDLQTLHGYIIYVLKAHRSVPLKWYYTNPGYLHVGCVLNSPSLPPYPHPLSQSPLPMVHQCH